MGNLLTPAALARIVPFVLFLVLLAARGNWPEGWTFFDARWLYALAVVVVSGSLLWFWKQYSELRQGLSLKHAVLSVAVGLVVYQIWIMTTEPWMMLGEPTAGFVPVDENGELIWSLVIFRWVGAALMVPIMEELFWRSFLMRWIQHPVFEAVARYSGSISAEHGVGSLKAAHLPHFKDPVALALMRSIKRALDPSNLLNPGRILSP